MAMDRGARRRLKHGDESPAAGLEVGPLELVLKAPQHYHVDVVAYSSYRESDGVYVDDQHFHNLVTNDVKIAETRVRQFATMLGGRKRSEVKVEQVTQCHDRSPSGERLHHLAGTEYDDENQQGHDENVPRVT